MSLTLLTKADIIECIAGAVVQDTYNLTGVGLGADVTAQALFDAIVECLMIEGTATATTVAGSGQISVAMPAGFTTDNIIGRPSFLNQGSAVELSITDTAADAGTGITYNLSGVETDPAGHLLTLKLQRLKTA